ncbi:MAG TPA: glycoside hydrolase family 172 protein [Allosphingosinicella sp.]
MSGSLRLLAGLSLAWAAGAAAAPVDDLLSIAALPRLKPWRAEAVTSYDRTGGNDDGFNGTYSFVRKEAEGLVIADLKGPGVVTRIWTPTPTDDAVEFYFDGERTPRIRTTFRTLFTGKDFPFLAPVSGVGAGGFYTYAPIPYRRSLKVLVRGTRVEFYQLNFATFPSGTNVESYSASSEGFRTRLEAARALFATSGSDIAARGAGDGSVESRPFSGTLAPGETLTLFESDKPGRIVGLKLSPARSLAGKERDILLNVYYDGDPRPAISVPAGDLFGYAWGEPAMGSLLAGTAGDTNYFYFPMPYDRSVRVELTSERSSGPIEVRGEAAFTGEARRPDEGKLYALWRREAPTTAGKPFTFLDTGGRGHLVGVMLQAQGTEPGAVTEFFEGDDVAVIDGKLAVHGTGSEDFFNGGWYDVPGRWAARVSLPVSGALDFKRHLGRSAGYRFFLGDAYPYRRSIVSTIEHGPEGNRVPGDYVSTTLFYSAERPNADLSLPPLATRRVDDPKRVVFTPGWNTPIQAFSWVDASLAKEDEPVDGEGLRHLAMKAKGREVFGPHYISFLCEMPTDGRYRVSIQPITGPDQAIVQLFEKEVAVGDPADLYATERHKGPEIALGELDLTEGDNAVMLKLVGSNPKSSAMNFDLYRLIFERVD